MSFLAGPPWVVASLAALAALTLLLSGVLRGFTGFGFAVFSAPILATFMPPAESAPILMGLQVLAGLQTLGGDIRQVAWRSAVPLFAAAAATVGLGSLLLALLPAAAFQLVIGFAVIAAVAALSRGVTLPGRPSLPVALGIGATAGVLNGMSAMGGPPLVVYFLGYGFPPLAARATMAVLFMSMGAVSLILHSRLQPVPGSVWLAIPCLFPFLAAGNACGTWLFRRSTARSYRRGAMALLAAVGLLSVANGVFALLR